jgi:ribosomal protein S27AE
MYKGAIATAARRICPDCNYMATHADKHPPNG